MFSKVMFPAKTVSAPGLTFNGMWGDTAAIVPEGAGKDVYGNVFSGEEWTRGSLDTPGLLRCDIFRYFFRGPSYDRLGIKRKEQI